MITTTVETKQTHVFANDDFQFRLPEAKLDELQMKCRKKPNETMDKVYLLVQKQMKLKKKETIDGLDWETACKEIFAEVEKMVRA